MAGATLAPESGHRRVTIQQPAGPPHPPGPQSEQTQHTHDTRGAHVPTKVPVTCFVVVVFITYYGVFTLSFIHRELGTETGPDSTEKMSCFN